MVPREPWYIAGQAEGVTLAMQHYQNDHIIVRFDPTVCVHSGNCVRGLHAVFDATRRPWVDVNAAAATIVAAQVARCPSGALTCELSEGR